MNQYCGTKPILESEPINIPNAKKCCKTHGLVAAIPREDMTFGAFKRKPAYEYKMRIKSLEKQQMEIEKRDKKEFEKINREREKAILEEYNRNDD